MLAEGAERLGGPEVVNGIKETVFPTHNRADVHMNTQ